LAWQIELTDIARKQLSKLDKQTALRITKFLRERVMPLENPRSIGKALVGAVFGSYWRYRVGDNRIICEIQDGKLCILVIEVGNRREVYR
jgi:mRNA interferase RelE/StbE